MPRRSAAGDADTQHGNSAALIASLRVFCNSVRPIKRPNGNGTRRKRPKAFNRHKSLDTLSYACVLNDTAEYSDNRSDTHACSSTNNIIPPSPQGYNSFPNVSQNKIHLSIHHPLASDPAPSGRPRTIIVSANLKRDAGTFTRGPFAPPPYFVSVVVAPVCYLSE